jgi:AmiR/NasT family two-component response regulator
LRSVEEIEVMDCQPVGSTASAMEVIRELKPDIVLIPTEFKMEFHVGEKLLGQIREEFPEVIVALHAPNAFNSAYDERAAPYDAIISKPCRAGELREIIVKLAKD